jgi:hypothetical protein
MIDLHSIGDGPRDHVTVPRLVGRMLGVTFRTREVQWARLRQVSGRSGYRRQLLFAIAQALDAGAAALLAVVDRDKDDKRTKLAELTTARDEARGNANLAILPVALGEAVPHGDAFLLDDPVAVRRGLRMGGDTSIPNVRHAKSPKDEIDRLRRESERAHDSILEVLEEIAGLIEPNRYAHPRETGFHRLAEDVRHEFAPLVTHCGEDCRCGDACQPP